MPARAGIASKDRPETASGIAMRASRLASLAPQHEELGVDAEAIRLRYGMDATVEPWHDDEVVVIRRRGFSGRPEVTA
jgi:hypothetical protein